jgi:DNA-binding response OmpR family regulator
MTKETKLETSEDILIVDDTLANLRMLSRILAESGYKTKPVTSGEQALAAAQAMPPDIILLDIMMPGMDGYEVCAQLKINERTKNIPVIFISALDEIADKVQAFEMGGVDYLTKPFQTQEVLARVRTHLTIQKLQRQLAQANQILRRQNKELKIRNTELQQALGTIKTLSGIVPICAWCHTKIQDENGEWVKLETYIEAHSNAEFTHGICPNCREEFNQQAQKLKKGH